MIAITTMHFKPKTGVGVYTFELFKNIRDIIPTKFINLHFTYWRRLSWGWSKGKFGEKKLINTLKDVVLKNSGDEIKIFHLID